MLKVNFKYIAMVWHPSVERHYPQFSKIFFSKTAWPIKAKFHLEPVILRKIMKVYENGPGYMPCPFMVKTFKNFSRTKSLMIIFKLGIRGAFGARGLQSLCIIIDIDGKQTQSSESINWKSLQ